MLSADSRARMSESSADDWVETATKHRRTANEYMLARQGKKAAVEFRLAAEATDRAALAHESAADDFRRAAEAATKKTADSRLAASADRSNAELAETMT